MKHKFVISALLIGSALLAFAAKDPVLMTINGKDVKLSEFEYLYNKTNQQQTEKESLDQYVEMFKLYKLKVADAEAAKLDTTPSFIEELNVHRDGIVKNSLEDTTVRDRLIKEAYERSLFNIDIDHLMIDRGQNFDENKKQIALADSLRTVLQNGANWEEIVEKYSIDPSRANNKGHYGYITINKFPYAFEKGAFDTPVGEISQPIHTDFGIHLVRVNAVRNNDIRVHARHILRLFPRKMKVLESEKEAVKAKVDSIYELVKTGEDFEELAKKYSEDPGSARRGGDLGFFGYGRMIPEFEKATFNLKDGEISEPIMTNYGWHIIQRVESKGPATFDEMKDEITSYIMRDERANMPREAKIKQAKELYNYAVNPELDSFIEEQIKINGAYDSTLVANLLNSEFTAYTYSDQKVPVMEIAKMLNPKSKYDNASAKGYILSFVETMSDNTVMDYYTSNLINDDPDKRNLFNEYRDGLLLFEISNMKVWEGASKDTVGLNAFFEKNRAKYNWNAPHFKGIILSAKNDSILDAVKADIAMMGHSDTLTTALHKKYSKSIKMERMVAAKGENKAADFLFFGAPSIGTNYPVAMVLEGGLIMNPENIADVKGQVTSDYQDILEKEWVESLKAKYPVVVNKKVLKQLKKKLKM